MITAALIGPFRGRSRFRIIRWFERMRNIVYAGWVALELWRVEIACYCPHLNTGLFFYGRAEERIFLEGCLEFIRITDISVALKGWKFSEGAVDEVTEAYRIGKRVYFWPEDKEILRKVGTGTIGTGARPLVRLR